MSQRGAKKYRRLVRRNQGKIIREFTEVLKGYSFKNRLRVAWSILWRK